MKSWRRRRRALALPRSPEPTSRAPLRGIRTQRPGTLWFASASKLILRSKSSTLEAGERFREGSRKASQIMTNRPSNSQLNPSPPRGRRPGSTTTSGLGQHGSTQHLGPQGFSCNFVRGAARRADPPGRPN